MNRQDAELGCITASSNTVIFPGRAKHQNEEKPVGALKGVQVRQQVKIICCILFCKMK
jgi:hypothetical protein